jgi:peptidase E
MRNIYLMAGGSFRKPNAMLPVFKDILREAGSEPVVGYIGAANSDDSMFFRFSAGLLKKAGASTVTHCILSRKKIDLISVKAVLKKADAVFFSGGDVEGGMALLSRHDLVPFLTDLYKNGTLFFGLSAGSIMLGTKWVRWEDPEDESSSELFDCTGIAGILCDTHAENENWEELKAAVRLSGENAIGYGIPTNAIICVRPDSSISALGKPVVCYTNRAGQVVKDNDLIPV